MLIDLIEQDRFGKLSLLLISLLSLLSKIVQTLKIVLRTLGVCRLLNQILDRLASVKLINLDDQVLFEFLIRNLNHHRIQLVYLFQLFLSCESVEKVLGFLRETRKPIEVVKCAVLLKFLHNKVDDFRV